MRKKILGFILCLALALSAALPAYAAELTMEGDWRLTSKLDITDAVTLNGSGKFNIYEMKEGAGLNIIGGSVTLQDTNLYPYSDPAPGSLAELSARYRLALAEAALAASGTGSAAANAQATVLAAVNAALSAAGGGYSAALEIAAYDAATGVWSGTLIVSGGGNKAVCTTAAGTYMATPQPGTDPGGDGGNDSGDDSGGSGSPSGGSGGGSSSSAAPGSLTAAGSAGGAKANLPAALDTNTGDVKITLNTAAARTLIDGALKASADARAASPNGAAPVPTVTIDLSSAAEAKSATLDVNAAKAFSAAAVALTVKLPAAQITLAPAALASLAAVTGTGTAPVRVEASAVGAGGLSGMQAAQAKGYEAVVNIDVFVDGQKVDIAATVSLPYTLKANESPGAVRAWHLGDDGSLTKLEGAYSAETKLITFTVNHQSYFVAGYDPVALWANIFSDVDPGEWYYDAVAYANHYGLFSGNGDGSFAPQSGMSRAMFATVLWSMEGRPAAGAPAFADVSPGAWYGGAVAWAAENGLFGGVGSITGGTFAPDKAITRQEMAAVLYNFAEYKGYTIPENREAPSYADQSQIDAWAETAAAELSAAGVFAGDSGNFAPQRESTRAEVAQMFRAFQRLVAGK